ncbi:MAG: dihydroxyacetone kinase family protein [Ornithinimicrobium sp.]|uniref:dihydroxyacetone kinase family protein n=1 Tax=Ornithinimicrobium sp. TaxID=1977084 RepID=UPI003D9AECF5
MAPLSNDPLHFPQEALHGLVQANSDYLQSVHGGVVRATESPQDEVAVVVGGGSGHYPAFAGWVGPGLAHGAACGNIFSSPSASQVYSVARAAHNGAGVVLNFGNYAGDVLHFGLAAERLRAEGVDVRIVTVTDDIASNSADKHEERRGIAGDLVVCKVLSAAAAEGCDLDTVEQLGRRANARTRTLGVAFAGCTAPGADQPLFTVPEGAMAIGLGVHGEPGIDEKSLGSASEVADLLLDGVLAEEPDRGQDGYDGQVAVLLNGLGATKYEELFVVYARVAERLAEHGLDIVQPEVGEHVTSLDMAGLSLTLTYLDDDLARLWTAPAASPAYRRGVVDDDAPAKVLEERSESETIDEGAPASQELATAATDALRRVASVLAEQEDHLGRLDSVAGDGDHGQGMVLGSSAALKSAESACDQGVGARTLFIRAGDAWSEGAGGTSGALWGAALTAVGGVLSDDEGATPQHAVEAVDRAEQTILRLGGAKEGDKTLVDALAPFARTLREQADGGSLAQAWQQAADAAHEAADQTAELKATLGRARTHGDKSVGTPDPGAISLAMVVTEIAAVLTEQS